MTERNKNETLNHETGVCVVGIARSRAESLASKLNQNAKRELQMKVAKAENVHSNQEEEARTRESA